MVWYLHNQQFDEQLINEQKLVGFVYLITEKNTGKLYVGQKVFFNKVAKKPLKGKKNRRIEKKFSDWKEYYGSNEELQQRVIEFGVDNYRREILHLCTAKSEMNYMEAYEIFARHALLNPDKYFNSWVSSRINRNQLKKMIG